jgi:hypothetical protein
VSRSANTENNGQLSSDEPCAGYNITRDLLAQLRRDDVVEAEVGIASRTILVIRSNIHPSQARMPR